MHKTLTIIPLLLKAHKCVQDYIGNLDHLFDGENRIFCYSYENTMELKQVLIENNYEYIVVAFPSLQNNFDQLQMVKSLSLKSKIILYCPELDFIKRADEFKRIGIENNNLRNWYLLGQSIQLNIYSQADLIIAKDLEDMELLKTKLKDIEVIALHGLNTKIHVRNRIGSKISIVVLTFNQYKLTKQLFESLCRHTELDYELIFVDNGSLDQTKEYLEKLQCENKNIKLIFNKQNMGFAKANNQGIRIASGDYVVLLNNDVILTDNWLERLLACVKSDPLIGVAGPCTNKAVGQQVINHKINMEESEIQKFGYMQVLKEAGNWLETHRIIGFCMVIKKEVLDNIGLLDERFGPGGFEDYDFCLRVKQAGYKIIIAKDVFIYHIGGQGYTDNNLDYDKLRCQNVSIFIDKWLKKALENMENMPENP